MIQKESSFVFGTAKDRLTANAGGPSGVMDSEGRTGNDRESKELWVNSPRSIQSAGRLSPSEKAASQSRVHSETVLIAACRIGPTVLTDREDYLE